MVAITEPHRSEQPEPTNFEILNCSNKVLYMISSISDIKTKSSYNVIEFSKIFTLFYIAFSIFATSIIDNEHI